MKTFINNNTRLIYSILFLFFSINCFVFVMRHAFINKVQYDTVEVENFLKIENDAMKGAIDSNVQNTILKDINIRSATYFLDLIGQVSDKSGIKINNISSGVDNAFTYNVEAYADHLAFLRFLTQVEALDVDIRNMNVGPAEEGQESPLRAISLSLTPRNSGATLDTERLASLQRSVDETAGRDPFQPDAALANAGNARSATFAADRPPFVLRGVVLSPENRVAIVQTNTSPKAVHLSEGQELEGWRVEGIQPNTVTMRNGRAQAQFALGEKPDWDSATTSPKQDAASKDLAPKDTPARKTDPPRADRPESAQQ